MGNSAWGSRFRVGGRHGAGAGAGAELGSGNVLRSPPACSKLRLFHGHGGPVWCLDFDPVTEMLVSGSYDRTLKVSFHRLPLACLDLLLILT